MSVNLRPDIDFASCSVVAQVGPVFTGNQGFTGVVRNGAGDYTLTQEDVVPTDAVYATAVFGAVAAFPVVEPLAGGLTCRIRTFDAGGLAIEASFSLSIRRA